MSSAMDGAVPLKGSSIIAAQIPSAGGAFVAIPKHAYFQGKIVPYSDAKVGVATHALNYGTAVFGGLRGYWNAEKKTVFVFRPLEHFRRYLHSCRTK